MELFEIDARVIYQEAESLKLSLKRKANIIVLLDIHLRDILWSSDNLKSRFELHMINFGNVFINFTANVLN